MPDLRPTVAIIGVGMIGGSLALALQRRAWAARVIGVGRSCAALELAVQLGAIDSIADDAAEAAAAADLIVLATPVNAMAPLFQAIRPALGAAGGKIITDVGSVKGGVCADAVAALGEHARRFVPGHPVAGKELSGVGAASATLFSDHPVILTPTPTTDADAVAQVRDMWHAAGAAVATMDAAAHDRVLSLVSHVPHVLAYAMVDFFADSDDLAEARDLAAGGFYDFTRTASSDAVMWRDICLMNRPQILRDLEKFKTHLDHLTALIENSDGDELESRFAAAKHARAAVTERRREEVS